VDANYRFIAVDIGSYGRQSDGRTLKNSILVQKLEKNELNFPEDVDLPHTGTKILFVVVGDEAFPLRKNLMRPYPGTGLTHDQRIFNYRLSRARRTVENAFGIMSTRFRVFRRPISIEPTKVDAVVKACVVLHNLSNVVSASATQESQQTESNYSTIHALRNLPRIGRRNSSDAMRVRQQLTEYFVSPVGAIRWQENVV